MTQKHLIVDLLHQDPTAAQTHLFRILNKHLQSPKLKRFRVAVSYATWGGLSLIASALEQFLERGGILETIYGVENGVTTADALLYTIYLRREYRQYKTAKSYSWNYLDSEFHPKYFGFHYPDQTIHIIGSANLTSGGLACNHELDLAISCCPASKLDQKISSWLSRWLARATDITTTSIRKASSAGLLGDEKQQKANKKGGVALRLVLPRAKKPLFQHILEGKKSTKSRHQVLADADAITEKPLYLFLQILKNETGGNYQIQLPAATQGAFFAVAPGKTQNVTFQFPELGDSATVRLTHFANKTHRIRLRPIRDIPRPAIIVFQRTADPAFYVCKVIPPSKYRAILQRKCTEQTREGSRRWGLEHKTRAAY